MSWFHRKRTPDREIEDELDYHIAMAAKERMEDGGDYEDAKYYAQRKLGNKTQIKEGTRGVWIQAWFETFSQDFKYGLRALRSNPGFAVVAVLTLALGIGANTAIFSVVESVLLRPLPFYSPERLFLVFETSDSKGVARTGSSGPDFQDYKDQNHAFEYLAELGPGFVYTWTGNGEPKTVRCTGVSEDFFPMLGVHPVLGRFYTPHEYHVDGVQVVISSRFWKEQLGGDPHILGQILNLSDTAMTVIGVAPPIPELFPDTDVWAKVVPDFAWMRLRNNKLMTVMGRLKAGVTREQAQQELTAILRRTPEEPSHIEAKLSPLKDELVGNVRTQLEIVMAAVGLVLLIACVNVAYLLLARVSKRQPEIAVRLSMGAGHARILRQFVTENLLLASLGAVLGTAFA